MSSPDSPDEFVLVRRVGAVTHLTLNRPRAINALNVDMVRTVRDAVRAAQNDGSPAIVLDGAGERGFCGGGDVKAMVAGGAAGGRAFLSNEYQADFAVHRSTVPVVGFMDGITMGGGIGLTSHAAVRIVTERSRLAMPETRIGIVPDVGGNLLLAQAPGRIGELLAITSGSFGAADAIALGFADHFVPSERLSELRDAFFAGSAVADAIERCAEPAPESTLCADHAWFDALADEALGSAEQTLADPVAAASRLLAALEGSSLDSAREVASTVRSMSPMSVVVALAQLARTRLAQLDLASVLADDYRVLGRLFERTDFSEGVRAHLIERDGAPLWSPTVIETLDPDAVAAILDPVLREDESPLAL
ncbi:MAG: enoyl-CoA hydratase/isomerase family protein [Microbacteriaceae bacterium]|nr:enoyl-CoA hydratase/isomerase family protein [Microbacteriaceae bacterium]